MLSTGVGRVDCRHELKAVRLVDVRVIRTAIICLTRLPCPEV